MVVSDIAKNTTVEDTSADYDPTQWVELFGDYLYRYAFLHLRNRESAEDVVQEAFLSAHKAWDRFERKSTVKTWLVSILRNKIIDYVRKNRKVQTVSYDGVGQDSSVDQSFNALGVWNEFLGEWEGNPEVLIEHQAFLERVKTCVKGLPENLRQPFVMRLVDELSTEEICENLDITPNNFWVILYRSRMRLRKCLDKNWFNPSN